MIIAEQDAGSALSRPGDPPASRGSALHALAPVIATAVAAAVYVITTPATADIAAHTYRAWLWDELGFAVWNAQWYGGHHMAGERGLLGRRGLGVLRRH